MVDTDQKILSGKKALAQEKQFSQYADLLSHHALDVMEAMAGLDRSSITQEQVDARKPQGDVFVKIQLVGDVKGEAVFGFSRELALHLLQTMTGMELTEIDELVQSALCELTNISCGNTATALTERGLQCDIKPPVVAQELVWDGTGSGVHVDTAFGGLEIGLLV